MLNICLQVKALKKILSAKVKEVLKLIVCYTYIIADNNKIFICLQIKILEETKDKEVLKLIVCYTYIIADILYLLVYR